MNILHLNASDDRGGAAHVAYRLVRGQRAAGHAAGMIVGRKYTDDPQVRLIRPPSAARDRLLRKAGHWLADDVSFPSARHILDWPEFRDADVVHCHNLHGYYFDLPTLALVAARKPVVWTFHDMWPITSHGAHSFDGPLERGFFQAPRLDIFPPIAWHGERRLERIKRAVYERADVHLVTPSRWLDALVGRSVLAGKPRSLIYNGIDTTVFKPLPHSNDVFTVLFCAKGGQDNPWKGGAYVQALIDRFRDDARVRFICVGGDRAGETGNVRRVPYVSDPRDLARIYASADLFLYPSVADNCPLAVLEALACGLPVLTFDTGGIPEIVEHGKTGYIARYRDEDDLMAGFDRIFGSRAGMPSLPLSFADTTMIRQYADLYRGVIAARTAAPRARRRGEAARERAAPGCEAVR